jgi:tetratricopeptide (TPR) repeat protein
MKPFLSFGWQPQIMAVEGTKKAIFAGRFEVYDVVADPAEARDLEPASGVPASLRKATDAYPVPTPGASPSAEALTEEAKRQLASLGYVSAGAQPVVRRDAPRPADMVRLFPVIDRASTLFVQQRYAEVIPLLEGILREDPYNLDAALRLATSHSMLGRDAQALAMFKRAAEVAPQSQDVRLYLALHHERGRNWPQAVPTLERIVADTPGRLPAVEALARVRERQGRVEEALALWQRVIALRPPVAGDFVKLGELAMATGRTPAAIESFEQARRLQGDSFRHDLELGVLYLAARRFEDARAALDRVPASHPEYPMALFKRAQVSVLLKEPDAPARIARARQRADASTRELITNERLFAPSR